ncbi:MAG TPA: hypothetical protein DCE42_02900 [Myxococcales bacterium]|nr:hypothetical protein [Deltaproteobacteria bacterium]HAA53674.1 hypothetical protein [Myxococcales bacterium]
MFRRGRAQPDLCVILFPPKRPFLDVSQSKTSATSYRLSSLTPKMFLPKHDNLSVVCQTIFLFELEMAILLLAN